MKKWHEFCVTTGRSDTVRNHEKALANKLNHLNVGPTEVHILRTEHSNHGIDTSTFFLAYVDTEKK